MALKFLDILLKNKITNITESKLYKIFEDDDDSINLNDIANDEYQVDDDQNNSDNTNSQNDIDYNDESILDEPSQTATSTPQDDKGANLGGGILPICQTTGKMLLAQRSDRVKEPGKWSIWGGRLDIATKNEANDKYIENKILEVFEILTKYNKFEKLIKSYIYKTQENEFEWHNLLGIVDEEFDPITNWEVMNYKWMTKDEIKALGRDNIHYGLQLLFDNDSASIRPLLIPKAKEENAQSEQPEENTQSEQPEENAQSEQSEENTQSEQSEENTQSEQSEENAQLSF